MIPTTTGYPKENVTVWRGRPDNSVKRGRIENIESIHTENGTIWTRWKSEILWERMVFLFTGKLWIGVMTKRLPPISCAIGPKL